jgi:hypothetical protein
VWDSEPASVEDVPDAEDDWDCPVSAHATPCPVAAATPTHTATVASQARWVGRRPDSAMPHPCTVIDVPFDIPS